MEDPIDFWHWVAGYFFRPQLDPDPYFATFEEMNREN